MHYNLHFAVCLSWNTLETLLRPYLLKLETLERCLVRALQPGALVHTGTTGDNGGRGQETQERSAQGFWAESTFLTSSNTFPVSEECLADVKEPTQLQSFKNNENNDLERVKSFFRKAVAPWKSCSHCSLCSSHFYKLSWACCRNSINSVNENALSVTWASPADRTDPTDRTWLAERIWKRIRTLCGRGTCGCGRTRKRSFLPLPPCRRHCAKLETHNPGEEFGALISLTPHLAFLTPWICFPDPREIH